MNPRIFELWEQSTGAAVPEEGFYSSASKYNIEKFAELIVGECVKVAMRSVSDDESKEAWYLIQEHFGVEEDEKDSACPLCGEDGGTTCGMPGCQY